MKPASAKSKPIARPSQAGKKAKKLQDKGRYQDAEKIWYEITEKSEDLDSLYNYALCLRENNKLVEALKVLARIIQIQPDSKTFVLMGRTYKELQEIDRAIKVLENAIAQDDQNHEAWAEMAIVYSVVQKSEHAILLMQKAIEIKGKNTAKYDHFMSVIFKNFIPKTFNQAFKDIILRALQAKDQTHMYYSKAWGQILSTDPVLLKSLLPLMKQDFGSFESVLTKMKQPAFFEDPYFYWGIKMMRLPYAYLEDFLQNLRRYFLRQLIDNDFPDDANNLLFALADQCFLSEYLYVVDAEEEKELEKIIDEVENNDFENIENLPQKIAIIGCYDPINQLKNNQNLAKFLRDKWPKDENIDNLLTIQIDESLEEERIKETIQSIGTIQDEVSQKVQEQYEENPYPRWKDYANSTTEKLEYARLAFKDFIPKNILIAGCGTGQQIAIKKLTYLETPITAIDISKASLAYAIRKSQEFKHKNIEFFHADILELRELNKTFDIIACTGVLHHMQDPLAGWQVLTDLLNPGGHMNIGLYSESARQNVVATRKFIEEHGYQPTPEGIRACRKHIKSLDKNNPVYSILESGDFYSLSSCRDLIFHVQEQRYTISRIRKEIEILGLEFKFMLPGSISDFQDYIKMHPDDKQMQDLEKMEKFEEKHPSAFSGMYQFWVRKPD